MNPDAVDLLNKIFKLHPMQRLGAGAPGTSLSIENLKKHPFFKGIDFKNIHKRSPPIHWESRQPPLSNTPSPEKGVLSRTESQASEATDDEDGLVLREYPKKCKLKDSDIIKSARLLKRNRWYFFQERKITLTNEPRLMYFKKGVYRGDIVLSGEMKAELAGRDRFNLVTPSRTFNFKVYAKDNAEEWVDLIRKVIKQVKS